MMKDYTGTAVPLQTNILEIQLGIKSEKYKYNAVLIALIGASVLFYLANAISEFPVGNQNTYLISCFRQNQYPVSE